MNDYDSPADNGPLPSHIPYVTLSRGGSPAREAVSLLGQARILC